MAIAPSVNSYLQYKRNTSSLIHWIVSTANGIPSSPLSRSGATITVADLVKLSRVISERVKPIPSSIYGLFSSVIDARKQSYSFYQQLVTTDAAGADPEIEASNCRHRAFIDALIAAYDALGGHGWQKQRDAVKRAGREPEEEEEEEEEALFVNSFEGLEVDDVGTNEENDDEKGKEEEAEPEEKKEVRPKSGSSGKKPKGKKGKAKAKGRKSKALKKAPVVEQTVTDIPLEDYKLVDGEGGMTDVLLAAWAFLKDVMELRGHIEKTWKKVAEKKLHSAAAGAVANMAIGMVKTLQFDISTDFPGYGNFEAIVNVATHRDPEKLRGKIKIVAGRMDLESGQMSSATPFVTLDAKECFFINTYNDLKDFITDYRKNRNGKPTKAMLSRLKWDPMLNLAHVSEAERLKWRSAYCINFLYDLVNAYAWPMLHGNRLGKVKPEDFDWSTEANFGNRMLYGPVEFASDITALAMKKTNDPIDQKILMHHVFTLQMAMDSTSVLRGWMHHPLKGPSVGRSWAWENQSGLKEIRDFKEHEHRGLRIACTLYLNFLEKDRIRHGDLRRHEFPLADVPLLRDEITMVLGSSMLAAEMPNSPTSRFANKNGLWVYSPFLCGTGLCEVLSVMFNYGMTAWDKSEVPVAFLHLYNLLRKNGHITQEIQIFETITQLFQRSVFVGGKPPTARFTSAWIAAADRKPLSQAPKRRHPTPGKIGPNGLGPYSKNDIYARSAIRWFHDKSMLRLLTDASWIPDRIADEDLSVYSMTAFHRLMKAFKLKKPPKVPSRVAKLQPDTRPIASSPAEAFAWMAQEREKAPVPKLSEDSVLVRRFRQAGFDQAFFDNLAQRAKPVNRPRVQPVSPDIEKKFEAQLRASGTIGGDYTFGGFQNSKPIMAESPWYDMTNSEYLKHFQTDVLEDIAGRRAPLSAFNYLSLLSCMMMMFEVLEEETRSLEGAKHVPVPPDLATHDAVLARAFGSCAAQDKRGDRLDNDVLRKMGSSLMAQMGPGGVFQFVYWDDLVDALDTVADQDPDDFGEGIPSFNAGCIIT